MALKAGTKFGPYEVLSSLGAGGMGEVYLATDSKLNRNVAIKVLPETMTRDKERVARFDREAKVLASLNHANIAAIYGFDDVNGNSFLVMEYVEGETLAARLKRGPLSVEEGLEVCEQITEALEAAHEKGVIHRDLKPANVMIRPDGRVKVLDFGLAKARAEDPSRSTLANSPTITANYTRPGAVLGTAAYMSPEQARGKQLDTRTDIWSFGVVLFECLSGRMPFKGETTSDLAAQILEREPDWTALPLPTPPLIQWLLRRCLAKDMQRRLRHVGDASVDIATARDDPTSAGLPFVSSVQEPRRRVRRIVAGAVLVGLAIGVLSAWVLWPDARRPVRRLEIGGESSSAVLGASLSPTGAHLALIRDDELWVRDLSSFDARKIPTTLGAMHPFWSPDERWIGFMVQNRIHKVPLSGGGVVTVCQVESEFTFGGGASWTDDGRIIFATGNSHLYEVSATGGVPRVWLKGNAATEYTLLSPAILPNGSGMLFCVQPRNSGWYISASDGTRRVEVARVKGASLIAPVYSPSGHVLFNRGGDNGGLWAVAFDAERLQVTGDAFLVDAQGYAASVSLDGDLAYARALGGMGNQLAWLSLDGSAESLGDAHGLMLFPALSPDERRVALSGYSEDQLDVWIHDLETGTRRRLTNNPMRELVCGWSPDASRICVASDSGRGFATRMISVEGGEQIGETIDGALWGQSADWSVYAVGRGSAETGLDIWAVWPTNEHQPIPVVQTEADEWMGRISPDGKWLAYDSDQTGIREVYLTRFPSGDGQWQVSADGGRKPVWAPDGKVLYYDVGGAVLVAVDVTTEPEVRFSASREIAKTAELGIGLDMGLSMSADGQRILVIRDASAEGRGSIAFVENWAATLKAGQR
jgi:serine/threonine protein kinase